VQCFETGVNLGCVAKSGTTVAICSDIEWLQISIATDFGYRSLLIFFRPKAARLSVFGCEEA
jgi:hypothetical protein